jgi:hypothetical protein
VTNVCWLNWPASDPPCMPALRTTFRERSRASSVVPSAYAAPVLSPTDSAVLSAILALGPADVATGRTTCSPVSVGGLPVLSPTASAAIGLEWAFLSSMIISVRLAHPVKMKQVSTGRNFRCSKRTFPRFGSAVSGHGECQPFQPWNNRRGSIDKRQRPFVGFPAAPTVESLTEWIVWIVRRQREQRHAGPKLHVVLQPLKTWSMPTPGRRGTGLSMTQRWRGPDSNRRSRFKRNGRWKVSPAEHRRLARGPALNHAAQLIVPHSFRQPQQTFLREGDREFESCSLQR